MTTGMASGGGPVRVTGGSGLRVEALGVALPGVSSVSPASAPSPTTVLERVDLEVRRGEVVVLLGPSGAGKSTLVAALLGMLPAGSLVRGNAWWDGGSHRAAGGRTPSVEGERIDLLDPEIAVRERMRGRVAAWLPQSPLASLTPVLSVSHHLKEKARVHAPADEAAGLVERALRRHQVDQSWRSRLPAQLSGGQLQRVSNALALLGNPGLVLADEPTTGLDRDRAAHAGEVLRVLAHDEGRAVLVVTHDLTLAQQIADSVVVLDGGRTTVHLTVEDLANQVAQASHTRVPHRRAADVVRSRRTGAGLSAVGLTVTRGRGQVVLHDVNLTVIPDRTIGLMAPSGAGKTTLLRTLALLHPPARGHVALEGSVVRGHGHRVPAATRRRIGYVAQDPRQAVDPRWTIARIVSEPLVLGPTGQGRVWRGVKGRGPVDPGTVARLLDRVGLLPELASRRPEEVSGGQLQRVVLARAFALDPDYLLLDEPTSMVDATTAGAVVAAVHEHQHATGCGVLVASHDARLLHTWCDEVVQWSALVRVGSSGS